MRKLRPLLLWVGLAAIGLLVQAWATHPDLPLSNTDAAKYLTLARNAPSHILFDGRTYLIHPPLHPWLIRAVASSGCSLAAAGAFLSSLCVAALALVICMLGRRLLDSWAAGVLASLLFLGSGATAYLGQGIWREPLQALLLYGLLLLTVWRRSPAEAEDDGATPSLQLRALAATLGAACGLTWDPFIFASPVLLASWRLQRRSLMLWAALGLVVTWFAWAGTRAVLLASDPTYPAGADGMVEPAAADGFSPAAFLNPNQLPLTKAMDRHHWPLGFSPQRPFQQLAPRFLHGPADVLRPEPSAAVSWGALGVFLLVVVGTALLVRAPPARWRDMVVMGVLALGLALPAMLGQQGRYAYPLLPALCLVAGACGRALAPRLERRHVEPIFGGGAALVLLALVLAQPGLSWSRTPTFEASGVEAACSRLGVTPAVVAGVRGTTPELAWRFPQARVVTVPLEASRVEPLLDARGVELVVLPHEVQVVDGSGGSLEASRVSGADGIRAVWEAARAGRYVHLGATVEADFVEGVRVFDLLWRGAAASQPRAFGFHIEADALPPLRAALETGRVTPATLRLLRSRRSELAAMPGEDAAVLVRLLGR